MMNRPRLNRSPLNRRWMLVSAVALIGSLGSAANASDVRITIGGGWSHGSSCSWHGHSTAGRISIDGCATTIRGDCDIREEVARAFRRAGYDAYCQGGDLVVRFGRCRPNLRWFGEGYGARFRWEHGCVRISFYQNSCSACSGHHTHTTWTWTRRDSRRDVCPPPTRRPHRPIGRPFHRDRCR